MGCVPRCVAAQPLMVYAAHAYAEGFVDTTAEGFTKGLLTPQPRDELGGTKAFLGVTLGNTIPMWILCP